MNEYKEGNGNVLVQMIKDGSIKKDNRLNHGLRFHGSYEQLHYDNFRLYLSTVSRYLQNRRLEVRKYDGD